jgi:hypothetical protein
LTEGLGTGFTRDETGGSGLLEGAFEGLTGAGVDLTGTGAGVEDLGGVGWLSGAGRTADDFCSTSPPRLTTEAEATEAERIRAAILEKCMSVEMDRRLVRED